MSDIENKPLRLAGVVRESIVDGPGIRLTVFVQGCAHNCLGCHNPETHDYNGGYEGNIKHILDVFDADPLLKGITLSGGEPFDQAEALIPLAKAVRSRGKDVVIFSGYTFEQLLKLGQTRPAVLELLRESFLLIDGSFILSQRDLTLLFRGSRNQRLIDTAESLILGKTVISDIEKRYLDAIK